MGEYNCTQCNKTFRSERALKFHTENHADEKSDKEWSARRERSRSRVRELSASRESIEDDAYKAGERGGRATSRRNLGLDTGVKNSLASLDQKTKTCMEPGCGRTFSTKVMLDFHMDREHNKKQEGALETDRKLFFGDRKNSLPPSGNNNSRKSMLSMSKEEYIDQGKKYACDECGQRFVSERAKNVHETTIHADKAEPSEKCNKCGKMFKSARALKTHLDIFHGGDAADEEDFKCSICNKTYSSQRSLNAHMSGHGRDADQSNAPSGYSSSRGSRWSSYQTKDAETEDERVYNVKMPNFISDRLKKEESVEPKKPLFDKYVVNTDIKSIFCKYCNEAFYTDRACEIHISLAHDGDVDREKRKKAKKHEEAEKMDVEEEEDPVNTFKCDEYPCKRKFPTWHGLKIHLKSSHKYTTADFALNCDTCGRKFSTKTSLENHIENAHYLKCGECDEKFQETHQLEAHIRRRHNKKMNKCDQCGREFRSADTLRLHMEIHKKPEFECMKCKRQFMTKGELDFHLMEHESDEKLQKLKEEAEAAEASKKWFCDNPKCNKSFLTEKSFKMHMDMHAAEQDDRKECPKCHKTFMTEKSLNFHIENFHPDVDLDQVELDKSKGVNSYEQEYKKDGWKCEECHRFFDSKQIYEYHMTRHANTFKCKECPEKFKTKQGLEMHMQEHQKKAVELHMCKVCSKEFDSAAMLRFHETTAHENQHDFECRKCGKVLSSESGLEMHMETHNFLESMEIKCQECGKKFSTERNLELHIETYHREEVIIKCLYCDRQFDSDATIGIHMKHNHPEEYKQMQRMKQPDNVNSAPVKERFKCPYEDCDATFRSENTLNLHVNNAHGFEDMEEFSARMNAMTQNRIQETLDDLDIDMPKTRASRREPEPEPEPQRYKCEECGSNFSSERTYKQHMEYIHPKEEKKEEPAWKCEECGKTFRIEAGYNLHMSNHKQEKEQASLQCEHCEMSFDSERQLSRHQRACVAKDQKEAREEAQKIRSRYETSRLPEPEPELEPVKRKSRYSIPEDSPEPERKTSTVQVSNLDHDDDDYRPASPQFECNLCKQKFLSEMMVKYHDCPEKKDEHDEFKCDQCGKTYWSEKMLKIHSRTHISYDDDIDEGILNMKIEMPVAKHTISASNEEDDELICDQCDQSFSSAILLRIHKKAHEREHLYDGGELLSTKKLDDEDDESGAPKTSVQELL